MNNFVVWMTGLSGSGKTTISGALLNHIDAVALDGDIVRNGLCYDLGFSLEDRKENVRRVSEVAKIFIDNNINVICSFISPTTGIRSIPRKILGSYFKEVFVKCSLDECERRDPKGLYKKARSGIINDFTGIGSPYEYPNDPDLIVDTEKNNLEECVKQILEFVS